MTDLDRIRQAINGDHGPDQRRIALHGLDLVSLLLRKNADYGGSAWQTPLLAPGMTPREAIQCRMPERKRRRKVATVLEWPKPRPYPELAMNWYRNKPEVWMR